MRALRWLVQAFDALLWAVFGRPDVCAQIGHQWPRRPTNLNPDPDPVEEVQYWIFTGPCPRCGEVLIGGVSHPVGVEPNLERTRPPGVIR